MTETSDGYGLLSRLREIEREIRRLRKDWRRFRDQPTPDGLEEVTRRTGRLSTSLEALARSARPEGIDTQREVPPRSPASPADRPEPRSVVVASRHIDAMLSEITRRWRALSDSDVERELERIVSLLRRSAERSSTLILALGGFVTRSGSGAPPRAAGGAAELGDRVTELDGRLWQLQADWQHLRQRPGPERLQLLMEAFESAASAAARLLEAGRRTGASEVRRALRTRRHGAEGAPFLPYRDPLTGAYNREGFDSLAGSELKRCRRYERPFGLLAVQVSAPDLAGLQRATGCVRAELRDYDLIARYADDRLVIGIPEGGPGPTRRVASRLLRALREGHMAGWLKQLSYATAPEDGATLSGLLDAAFDRWRP
jgi:GGDEF domain-containing protein